MTLVDPGRAIGPKLRIIRGGEASQLSDDELIAEFDRGHRAASAEIYDRLNRVVDATLYRMLGERGPDHDDLVQSAFEQIVLTLRRHRFAQACSLKAWAGAITARVALSTIRRRQRERHVLDRRECATDLVESSASRADVEADVTTRAELDRLRQHLGEITPDRSEVVVLYHLLEHDLATIGAMLGISVAAAQSRLVRGRRELQERMAAGHTRPPTGGAK